MRFRTSVLGAIVLSFVCSSAVQAQSPRTFVASTGSDANPCSRPSPCRNFAAAVAATASGGEVVVLDSAGYGPVSIGQSVSIIAPAGVYAGITATAGNGITVSAPGGKVSLRGLAINGQGASYGIVVSAAAMVHIDNCVVTNFAQQGLSAGSAGDLLLANSDFIGNYYGVGIGTATGTLNAVMDHCRIERSTQHGLLVGGTALAVRDSTIANNEYMGVFNGGVLFVKNCVIANNAAYGIWNDGGTATVSGSTVTANGNYGFDNFSGSFYSMGTNDVTGNGVGQTSGTITPIAQQ